MELEDQIEVLESLAERLKFLDMERVAIHGWSYGGYISLIALATKPHIFKVSVILQYLAIHFQNSFSYPTLKVLR